MQFRIQNSKFTISPALSPQSPAPVLLLLSMILLSALAVGAGPQAVTTEPKQVLLPAGLTGKPFDVTRHVVALAEIREGGPARDSIPALMYPTFLAAHEAPGILKDSDRVLGVFLHGVAKAYPVRILNWHELVNDELGGRPILVSWCPLCGSGIVYDPVIDSQRYNFGVSENLYKGNLLFFDRQTGSLWSQLLCEAVTGPLAGTRLHTLPAENTTWSAWKQSHPATLVLSFATQYQRNYKQDLYADFRFPLRPALLVSDGEHVRIYPFSELKKMGGKLAGQLGADSFRISFDQRAKAARVESQVTITYFVGFLDDLEAFFPEAEVFHFRKQGSILACVIPAALALSQNGPPTSQVSPSTQGNNAAQMATGRPEQSPDNVLNTQTKAVNAIPEEETPKLVDATSPTSRVGVGLDDSESTAAFARLIEQGKFEEVEPLLVGYLKEKPTSWRAHYFYGYVLLRQHRMTDSMKELAKSLELNTENAEAHKVLGRVLAIGGRYGLALRELDEAHRLTPNSVEVYYDRGRIFSIQDDFHRARKEFETAIHINPDYMEAFNALGFALEALGDDPAALTNYRKAIQLNEQEHRRFDAPYVNLSGYYRQHGDFPMALEYALRALELNPNSDLAYYQMAKTYRTMGDWPRTAEALEKAIAINPTLAQYHYVLSFAYRKLGREKESLAALAEFRKIEQQTADLERQVREARRATFPPEPRHNQ